MAPGGPQDHRERPKANVVALWLTGFLLALAVSACAQPDRQGPGYGADPIARMQKETPFTIVLPKYWPEGIEPYPSTVGGPEKDRFDSVSIFLVYRHVTASSRIEIVQINRPIRPAPALSFDVNGTEVVEWELMGASFTEPYSPSAPVLIPGRSYMWVKDGVSFDVRIFGYDRAESRKVIESMIR